MDGLWRIDLLGEMRATRGERVIARWPTRKSGFLLAYLALHLERSHRREVLVELFWPESDPRAGRQSLSQALYVLRRHLEPPGSPTGAVLLADRVSVRLNPEAVTTDVGAFQAVLQAAARSARPEERMDALLQAVEIYRGELLPGCHEAWTLTLREWLAESFAQALSQLVPLLEEAGDLQGALTHARRAVCVDPLREEAQREVIRLLDAIGQPAAAGRQYRELERLLRQELDTAPGAETQALIQQIQSRSIPPEPADARPSGPGPERMPTDTAGVAPHLPQRLTRFFGREAELARLRETLLADRSRLVTLTGPGGSGKTRLALEAAARLAEAWRGEVWFVPLEDLLDPRLVTEAVRDALSLPRAPQADPLEQVVEALARRPALLVLDNFEHLVTGGAIAVRQLLARMPALTCLITSRQRLNLAGEREFPVLPLPVPHAGSEGLEALARCPSVQLFVERAQAVRPDFQVSPANAADVALLCRRLEGIPLALELAAARAQVLSPAQMLTQLERRFDFLVSRHRDAEARHRTLRAAVEWSYQLHSPEVKRFFTRLSVFRGGWSLAAAAVCTRPSGELGAQGAELGEEAGPALTPSGSEATALDYLQQLREGSMVLAEEIGKEVRFRLLETMREYAAEQLSPAERDVLQRRHAEYYLSVAEGAESELRGADQGVWLDRLEQEHDNLRAALQWAVTQEAAEAGLRLCGALWEFWEVRGHVAEGRERLAAVLALPAGAPFVGGGERALSCRLPGATPLGGGHPTRGAEPREGPPRGSPSQPATRAKALLGAGALANDQGEFADARAFLEESLDICQALRDEPGIALSLHHLGDVALYEGDWETAEALYEESIAIRRRFGQRRELAMSLESLGTLVFKQGHLETACALYQESLAIRRELQDRLELAYSLGRVGNIALCRGDYRTARAHYEESLAIFRQFGSREGVSDMLQNLGAVAHAEGDLPTARALFEETLTIRRELGIRRCLAQSLNHLGEVACGQGDCEAARALCEESLAIGRALGYKEGIAHGLSVLGSLALRQGDWEAARARYQESLALRIELGHRLSFADSLEGLAAAEQAQGEHEQAARLLGSAASLRQAIGCPLPPREQRAYEELRAALRAALGEALYAAAWATGRALPWEETAAEALAEPDIDRPGENGGPLRLFSEYFEGRAV